MSVRALRFLALAMLALCGAPFAFAIEAAAAEGRPLRVATGAMAPFVLPRGDQLTGFSIDLWTELARRMRVDFVWVDKGSRSEQLESVRGGEVDVAISALVMTPERERIVDFSQSYFDSGLQIMVRAESGSEAIDALLAIPWAAIGRLFVAAIVVMFLWANVLWVVERRRNPALARSYVAGIGEALWRTLLIMATGEHGDRDAPGALRRLLIACVWLVGIVLIAQLTATVTSTQTVHRLRSNIAGPADLPGKTIATVPDTVAAAYLAQARLPIVEVGGAGDGIDLLLRGKVQALVFDAPTLQYWAARSGGGALRVVGPVFRPEKYGIVVPVGSPLRKKINEALLGVYQDGTYEEIYARWFTGGG